jgi:formylglycine-generating enzyme required for sulfatase activity
MVQPQLTLNKRQSRNQCYDEALAEGVLPLRMMQIPAGTFLMGSPEDELERQEREGPQNEVTLSRFFMGKYPITQAQWRAVAALPQVERELKADPSHFKGDLHPVESVSWYDAVEFCDRLTILTDRQYRLPTEAEWEYACRAGTTTPFHFGKTITTELANYRGTDNESMKWSGSYGDGPKGEHREETTPVNQFEGANAFGLCDMHGNVWEWCQDYWHDSYEGVPTDGSAWIEGGNSERRILRGGSWIYFPRYCRSACRDFNGPGGGDFNIGFRVVCSAPRALQRPTG